MMARVLVAEDNKMNQQVVTTMLNLIGCDVSLVENGRLVIEKLKSETFNLVLMDGQMPEMDGYEASQRIREGQAGEASRSIPILAVTANANREDIQKCFDVGMNDILSKPLEFEDFSGKVKKFLNFEMSPIDKKAIDSLKEMAASGNKKLLNDLIVLFSQETVVCLKKLRMEIESKELVNAAKTAHHLKSSCANLGVFRMCDLTEKIEKYKLDVRQDQLLKWVLELEMEFRRALEVLKRN